MKMAIFFSLLITSNSYFVNAQIDTSYQNIIDSIDKSFTYQSGKISLPEGDGVLNVPNGFRFLDRKQASYVLSDLWGNPADSVILGMLVPDKMSVLDSNAWVFTIYYDEMGYVKDDDANDIDYDDLLKDQQKSILEENDERVKNNYEPVSLIGWASPPYYDSNRKVLHWAKELKFGESEINTLNYNLRVLGRKGIFLINAIADMKALPQVKLNVDKVLSSVSFNSGSKYEDFDPKMDNVAAYTVGGLVAGKVLAKAGFFVFLAKFWKLIAVALAASGGYILNFFKSKKKNQEIETSEEPQISNDDKSDQEINS